jgi:protein-S-isoprenylcysteine O-methyltransferase Ste14
MARDFGEILTNRAPQAPRGRVHALAAGHSPIGRFGRKLVLQEGGGAMDPLTAIYRLWDLWLVSWVIAAAWAARSAARAPVFSELWRDVLAFGGGVVVFGFSAPEAVAVHGPLSALHAALLAPLWRTPAPLGWALVSLTFAGLAFSWWARLHLGRLWSGVAGRKAGHVVVDSGPYALVRHPIYTGLFVGLLAMALEKGTAAALAGLVVSAAGLRLKAGLEERFLRAELGEAAYEAYARRVPMLVPGPRRAREGAG